MKKAMQARQRGISFSGFLVGAVLLIFVALIGMKLIPAYIQDMRIKNIFITLASDPEIQKASIREIQIAYSKRADIDDVTAIQPEDIDIEKGDGSLALSATYSLKIPLVANVSLFLDFNPSSEK